MSSISSRGASRATKIAALADSNAIRKHNFVVEICANNAADPVGLLVAWCSFALLFLSGATTLPHHPNEVRAPQRYGGPQSAHGEHIEPDGGITDPGIGEKPPTL